MMEQDDHLIRDVQAAALLDVCVATFRNYVHGGLMPKPRRLGRRTRWLLSEVVEVMRRLPR